MEDAAATAAQPAAAKDERALLRGGTRGISAALVEDELGRATRCKCGGGGRECMMRGYSGSAARDVAT